MNAGCSILISKFVKPPENDDLSFQRIWKLWFLWSMTNTKLFEKKNGSLSETIYSTTGMDAVILVKLFKWPSISQAQKCYGKLKHLEYLHLLDILLISRAHFQFLSKWPPRNDGLQLKLAIRVEGFSNQTTTTLLLCSFISPPVGRPMSQYLEPLATLAAQSTDWPRGKSAIFRFRIILVDVDCHYSADLSCAFWPFVFVSSVAQHGANTL